MGQMAGESRLRTAGCLIQSVFSYSVHLWLVGPHGPNITDFNRMIMGDLCSDLTLVLSGSNRK